MQVVAEGTAPREHLLRQGAAEAVCEGMQKHIAEETAQEAGSTTLHALASGGVTPFGDHLLRVTQAGGVTCLVRPESDCNAFHKCSAHLAQQRARTALRRDVHARAAIWQHLWHTRSHPRPRAKVVRLSHLRGASLPFDVVRSCHSGVPRLKPAQVSAIHAHPNSPAVITTALDALSAIVSSPAAGSVAIHQGIVDAVLEALKTYAADDERCAQVLNLVGSLAHGEDTAAAASAAIQPAVGFLTSRRDSPPLQRAALSALSSLCAAPENRAAMLTPEVLEGALGALTDDRGPETDLAACFLLGRLSLQAGFDTAALAARAEAVGPALPPPHGGEPPVTAVLAAAVARARSPEAAGYAAAALDALRHDPRAVVKESSASTAFRHFLYGTADVPHGSAFLDGDPIRTAVVVAEQAATSPHAAKRACDLLVAVASLGGAAAFRVSEAGAMRATVAIMAQRDTTSHASAIALVNKLSSGSQAGKDALEGTTILPQVVQMLGSPTEDVRAAAASAVNALAQNRCASSRGREANRVSRCYVTKKSPPLD